MKWTKTHSKAAGLIGLLRYATAAAAALLLAALSFSTTYEPTVTRPPWKSPVPALSEGRGAARVEVSAYVSPGVGLMVAKDLEGRPVGELSIAGHDVRIEILDGVAKTTIEEIFVNHTDKRLEGTFHFPLPADASISRLAMEINGKLMEGTCLERERAREVYEGIVRKMCDPALLEWMPGNIFKCRIFPIDPRGEKRVIIGYTQALPYFDGRMKYVYPLASEKAKEHALGRVSIEAALKFEGTLKRVQCPSHRADVAMKDAHEATARYEARDLRPENDFVLDLQLDDRQEFTRVPHKRDGEDGYFMALYTPQGKRDQIAAPRKVAFVVDVSASVSGADLEVSRSLVQACLDKLGEKDSFVIFSHHIEATRFAGTKREALTFLADLKTGGASNLLAALKAAAAERPDEIVYVGKGVPTFGEKEKFDFDFSGSLRTIAVGSRSGTELLDRLALQYRGASFAINPSDFVAARIREIVSTLGAELITDIKVEGSEAIYDLAPARPRNLYAGERLVLTGRFRASGGALKIAGREFSCAFPAKEEGNNFVRRLWAQRKIVELLAAGEAKKAEVIALSVKHQIMTPFTSFLVLETEEAYKQWNIDRQKQKEDKLLAAKAPEVKSDIKSEDEQWRKIAEEAAKGRTVGEQQAIVESEKRYDMALFLHRKGYFEKARLEAQAAVEKWHENLPARDLLAKIDALIIGRPQGTDSHDNAGVGLQQRELEITNHVLNGERYYNARMYDEAIREFADADFKIRSLPPERQDMKNLTSKVGLSLDKAWDARIVEDTRVREMKRKEAESEAAAHAINSRREKASVQLKGRGKSYIPNYNIQIATAAVVPDPNPFFGETEGLEWNNNASLELDGLRYVLSSIQDFPGVDVARRPGGEVPNTGLTDIDEQAVGDLGNSGPGFVSQETARLPAWDVRAVNLHTLLKRDALTGIALDPLARGDLSATSPGITYQKTPVEEFPDRLVWEEIRNRKPKGLAELEDEMDPADKEIAEKLKQIRISWDFKSEPLPRVIDYVREISGLNLLIERKGILEKPDEVPITSRITDTSLDSALRLILSLKQLAHYVQGGVIIITPAEVLKRRIKLELYDVQGFGIEGDRLADLIRTQVSPKEWDEADAKSICYNNGLLIVRNTPEMQKAVRSFILKLRESEGPMVAEVKSADQGDTVLSKVGKEGFFKGQCLAVTREKKFIAIVVVTDVADGRAAARILKAVRVGPIRPGDRASLLIDPVMYLASLPNEVKLDLASAENLNRVRARLKIYRRSVGE